MRALLLLALVLAGCCAQTTPPVDVDALNAVEQAGLQAQADRENLEKLKKLK